MKSDTAYRKTAGSGEALRSVHWGLLAALVLLQFIDGFDLVAMSLAATPLSKDWNLSPRQLGIVLAAAQIGSLAGAALVGAVAAKAGRKTLIIVTALTIGLSSLAASFTTSFSSLLACRLVTGIGLGGMAPLVIGYTPEFFPAARRAFASSVVLSSVQAGQIIGGVVAAIVIPRFGWEAVFVIGGVAPLALLPFLLRLPASQVDLARQTGGERGIAANCAKYGVERQTIAGEGAGKISIRDSFAILFARRAVRPLALFILASFTGAICVFFMNTWAVVLVEKRGLPHSAAVLSLSAFHVGAMLGVLLIGWLISRLPPYRVLPIAILLAIPLLALLAYAPPIALVTQALFLLIGVFMSGGLLSMLTLAVNSFQPELRVTSAGAIMFSGRLAGVLGPISIGAIISEGSGPQSIFLLIAAILTIPAALVFILRR